MWRTGDGTAVFTYFKSGTLAAVDLNGKERWKTNLVERFGPEASTIGSVKQRVAPLPGSLCTQIRPPCCSTMRSQTARPMPVPG